MYQLVFIIQSTQTGRFLCTDLSTTFDMRQAGIFLEKDAALDTGVLHFDGDFVVYDFYIKILNLGYKKQF